MININMTKAVEIQKNIVRAERAPRLQELDLEAMKNFNNSTALAEIEAEKQVLRDITTSPRFTEAKTPDELKALSLDELLSEPQ